MTNHLIKITFSCVLICISISLFSQSAAVSEWVYIQKQSHEGNYLKAVDLLKKMEIADGDSLRYLKTLSSFYYRLGNYSEAKFFAQKALQKSPEEKSVLNQLGAIYDAEQNLPKAIKYYVKLLQTDTTNPYYQKQNAFMLLKAGFKSGAFIHFAKAYQLNPADVVVVSELADLLLESEQFSQVDSILDIAYQQDTTNIKILLSQARSKYQQKEYSSVVEKIEKALGQIDLPEYYIKMLGYSYLQIDSVDHAIRWLERLIHSEQREFVHYYLAIAYDKKGDTEASLFHYDQAIQKSISESVDRYYAEAAETLEKMGDLKKAIKYYQEAVHFNPNPKYYYQLGILSDAYYKDKNIAIRYFDKYIQAEKKNSAFKDYARKRLKILKEQNHFSKNTSHK